jgi:lipid-binding SYLF domain-containing protein
VLSGSLPAQNQETRIVEQSCNVLNEIMAIPASSIPQSMFSDARGLVIIPNMVKGGFVVGVKHGKGVAVIKDESGAWRPPVFVSMTGGSVGWQAGLQATDVVLVFRTQKSVQGLMSGKFTIGADAAAAAGPVGRQATAATDAQLKAEILSYSRSRGLFAGLSVDGSALTVDNAANQVYYQGTGMTPAGTVVGENAQLPPSAVKLLQQVAVYSAPPQPQNPVLQPGAQPGVPMEGSVATNPTPAVGQPLPLTQPEPSLVGPPGPAPNAAAQPPAPGSQAAIEAENSTRLKLAGASQQLQTLVDNTWKQFLSLPAEVYQGNVPPSIESLAAALARYDAVAGNPQYAALVQRAEFQTAHTLLKQYLASRKSNTAAVGLTLPPPPTMPTGQNPVSNGRY